jgi:hypothetical protein
MSFIFETRDYKFFLANNPYCILPHSREKIFISGIDFIDTEVGTLNILIRSPSFSLSELEFLNVTDEERKQFIEYKRCNGI